MIIIVCKIGTEFVPLTGIHLFLCASVTKSMFEWHLEQVLDAASNPLASLYSVFCTEYDFSLQSRGRPILQRKAESIVELQLQLECISTYTDWIYIVIQISIFGIRANAFLKEISLVHRWTVSTNQIEIEFDWFSKMGKWSLYELTMRFNLIGSVKWESAVIPLWIEN